MCEIRLSFTWKKTEIAFEDCELMIFDGAVARDENFVVWAG